MSVPSPPPIAATGKSYLPPQKTLRHRARLPLNGNELLLCYTPPARFREGDSSNVDQVLTKMRTTYTQVKQSTFKLLFYLYNLVAGV